MKNTLIFLAKRNRAGQIITAVPKKVTAKFAEFALKRNNVNKGGKWGTKEDFHQFNFEEKPKVEPKPIEPKKEVEKVVEEKPAPKRRLKKAEKPVEEETKTEEQTLPTKDTKSDSDDSKKDEQTK